MTVATVAETTINATSIVSMGPTTWKCVVIGNDYNTLPQGELNVGGIVYSSGVPVSRTIDIFDAATNAYVGSSQSNSIGVWIYQNLPTRPSGYYVVARGLGPPEEDAIRLNVSPPELNIELDVNLIITRTYSG